MTTVIRNRKLHLISLGCARNRVDSEVMLGTLLAKDWLVTQDPKTADAIVINTCGFIGPAKQESIDTILAAAEHKKQNPEMKLVVTGCLTQRYKRQLAQGLPEVDLFIGTDQFVDIGSLLDGPQETGAVYAKRTHYLYNERMPRVNTLGRYSAYVKVAEGCQHNCAFCIIPAIRGRLRSRPITSIVREVEELVADGVVEVNLIAQDLAAYGRDQTRSEHGTGDGPTLLQLLKRLAKVPDLQWIRCLYVYPENISDEFLDFFAAEPKLVKYLDIPVQHANDKILRAMNRDVTRQQLEATIVRVRESVPGVAIRTSVMVGFPGESQTEFEELKDFVRDQKFEHLGCFAYSREEGTVASRLPGQIDEALKRQRVEEIMSLQQSVSRGSLRSLRGRILPVLVEGPSQETDLLWQGRLSTQAPEVDGLVYINDGPMRPGEIQMVRLTHSHEYDLVGEILDRHSSDVAGTASESAGQNSLL